MWTSDGINFYSGDCRPGDRAATAPELAALAIGKAKREKGAAIEAAYNAAIAQGVPYGGKVLQVREQDRPNVVAVFARAMANVLFTLMTAMDPEADLPSVPWPEGGHKFAMLDNSTPAFTQAEFIAMAVKAAGRVTAIRMNVLRLKGELAVAATLAEVAAVDHAAGWQE